MDKAGTLETVSGKAASKRERQLTPPLDENVTDMASAGVGVAGGSRWRLYPGGHLPASGTFGGRGQPSRCQHVKQNPPKTSPAPQILKPQRTQTSVSISYVSSGSSGSVGICGLGSGSAFTGPIHSISECSEVHITEGLRGNPCYLNPKLTNYTD